MEPVKVFFYWIVFIFLSITIFNACELEEPVTSTSPEVTITGPVAGTESKYGEEITFTGTCTDREDGVITGPALKWTSSRDGSIGSGESLSVSNLSVGLHMIILSVTDSEGLKDTSAILVTITSASENEVNQSPLVMISNPEEDTVIELNSEITLQGIAQDSEDGTLSDASMFWTSSVDGDIGTGKVLTINNLTQDSHIITLTAMDSKGLTGTDTILITVVEKSYPPVINILKPATTSTFIVNSSIEFQAEVYDPQDGDLTGDSLVWTSDKDGQIGTGSLFSISDLSLNTHIVTLKATDSDGEFTSKSIVIGLQEIEDPTFHSSNILTDETWTVAGSPHIITSDITVAGAAPNGATLTIEAGAVVRFDSGKSLIIGATNAPGRILAQGTGELPIVFTSNQVIKSKGWWDRILFNSTDANSVLEHCVIEYGGGDSSSDRNATIIIYSANNVTLDSCEVNNSLYNGIKYINNSGIINISNSVIQNGNQYGIVLYPDQVRYITSDCLFSSNDSGAVYIKEGTLTQSSTWYAFDNYIIENLTISNTSGVILTIEPGSELRFISGATLDVRTNSSLLATGTAVDPIIFTSDQDIKTSGWWDHIRFFSDSNGGTFDYCTVEYAGALNTYGEHNGNIVIWGADNVSITNSTINNGQYNGLYSVDETGSVTVSNTLFSGNEEYGINLFPDQIGGIGSDTSVVNNDLGGVYVRGGDLQTTATWYPLDSYYSVGNINVFDTTGVVFTIEAGTELRFRSGAALDVGTNSSLLANGTSLNPIVFTSDQDTKTPGWWDHIRFIGDTASGNLEYCIVEYAGAINTYDEHNGNIVIWDAEDISINNCIVRYGQYNGLFSVTSSGTVNLVNNTFSNNEKYGIKLYPDQIRGIDANTSVDNNSLGGVYVISGDLSTTATWHPLDSFYSLGNVNVSNATGVVFTIEPGTDLRFRSGASLDVLTNASFIATGTSVDPIIFTSDQDIKTKGWWDHIRFIGNTASGNLSYCTVEYAGAINTYGEHNGNIVIWGSDTVTLNNCTIKDGQYNGVYSVDSSGSIQITDSLFNDNDQYGISLTANQIQGIDSLSSVTGNALGGVYVRSGTVTDSTIWNTLDSYYVVNNVTVSGSILTIEEGNDLRFNQEGWIDVVTNGRLIANGTFDSPITFTSNQEVKTKGWWDYIRFKDNSNGNIMRYCLVEYAGADYYYGERDANIYIWTPNAVVIENCRIENGDRNGIKIASGTTHSLNGTYLTNIDEVEIQVESGASYTGTTSETPPFN